MNIQTCSIWRKGQFRNRNQSFKQLYEKMFECKVTE